MENKQTAVEWLIDQLYKHDGHINLLDVATLNGYFDQAKAMERKQIEEAYNAGFEDNTGIHTHDLKWGGKYFTKTYQNGKEI